MSQVSALSLQDRLREGVIEHPRRWSGDTHDDLGGSVDVEKTDALMREAAVEIDRLTAELEAVRQAKEPAGFGDAR